MLFDRFELPCPIFSNNSSLAIESSIEELFAEKPITGLINNAAGNFISRTKDLSPKLITSASFYFVGIPCLIYLLFSDFGIFIKDNPNSIDGIYSIIILAVICTAFAVLLFNRMIQISSPVFASSITFTIPVVALVIGFYNKEEINFIQIIGMCTILTGVFFINKK